MFHPQPPSPCFLYGWPAMQAMEAIYNAVAEAMPEAVPRVLAAATSARSSGGASARRPASLGATARRTRSARAPRSTATARASLHPPCEAATRFSPTEVWEAKNPWLLEQVELAPDSCGPGRHRGGLGVDMVFHSLEDAYVDLGGRADEERAVGARGRRRGAAELAASCGSPTEPRSRFGKATRLLDAEGVRRSSFHCGGGGGYGPPSERDPEAVRADLREGYITEEHARAPLPARVQRRLMHRCAVDVGGTFIDFVLLDEETGELVVEKQPARRETLVDEFLAGLERLPVGLPELDLLFHGTTVGINAVLQERGARVGLVTTAGFRDVLALGRGSRPELYNVLYRPPAPLVPRYLRREVPERLAGDGSVLVPLDLDALDREVDLLVTEGVEAVAICFLHAYLEPGTSGWRRHASGSVIPRSRSPRRTRWRRSGASSSAPRRPS